MLESRYSPIHLLLDIIRHRGRHAIHIHFICIFPLRLDKNLMAVMIREFNHLIFNGGTISGPSSFDHAGVYRRTVYIISYYFVCIIVCISEPARHLFNLNTLWVC